MQSAFDFFQAHPFILALIKILIVLLVLSGIVAYLVYMERKVLSFMQARLGPMRVGPWGLLQPVADGIKLLLKEDIIPAGADKFVFLLAPAISVMAVHVEGTQFQKTFTMELLRDRRLPARAVHPMPTR